MKIFKDKELTQEIINNIFDFEIVKAGDSSEKLYYVLNDTLATLTKLEFSIVHVESRVTDKVEIVEAPKELVPQGVGELKIRWDASVELEQGLKMGLNITGRRLYG